VGSRQGGELIAGFEVRDEEIESTLVVEPVAVNTHAPRRTVVADFETFDETGLDELSGDGFQECRKLKVAVCLSSGQRLLAEIVKELLWRRVHCLLPKHPGFSTFEALQGFDLNLVRKPGDPAGQSRTDKSREGALHPVGLPAAHHEMRFVIVR